MSLGMIGKIMETKAIDAVGSDDNSIRKKIN